MPSVSLNYSTQILNDDFQPVNKLDEHILIQDKLSKEFSNNKIHAFNSENSETRVISVSNFSNGFVAAILQAYSLNQHLLLSPDDVWLVIAQGISQHINYNSEKYRERVVKHQGQKRVEIYAGDINEEDEENEGEGEDENKNENKPSNWTTLFDRLNDAMSELITIKDLLTCNFSTSTKLTKLSSELVLYNSVHPRSNYEKINNLSSKSGIHKITLDGTLDDWLLIQQKVNYLRKLSLDLDFWLDRLDLVLHQFVSTYSGDDIDLNFWNTIATEIYFGKEDNIMLTGWISAFFPYAKENVPLDVNCIRVFDIPDGRVSIPFVDPNDSPSIRVVTGFFGAKQEIRTENNEIIVSPVIGWAITDS